ncbi:hypothetical protein LXA43DRAFT_974548 [Ganoderma leucocontextum]|nr:hypothetical protein LXA43DRAFT_974548 [Ganoderma leucocontextum]
MSTNRSNLKATVAILGGTRNLGYYISKIFLTEYRWAFPTVRLTTREASSAKAQELAKLGAEIHSFDDSLDTFLAGVDLVVNTLSISVTLEFKTGLLHALVRNGVKVYFPASTPASNDYVNTDLFPGYSHEEWPKKRALALETNAILEGKVKIIRLDAGGFLTWWVGPGRLFNWDAEKNVYTIVGPSTVAVLALDPATAATVPGHIYFAGNIVNYEDLREIVSHIKGVSKREIVCKDIAASKEALKKNPTQNVLDYVIILTGEGNDNEFVNPGQSLWKWKTVEEELRGL